MPLVKGNQIVSDEFVTQGDDDAIPAGGNVLVPAARFLADAEAILARGGKVGVIWPNGRDIEELAPYLQKLAAVALVFPNFRDGRAYSQSRILRERYAYTGEVRATGQVLRDQFVFMLRAGFDSFLVNKESDAEAFANVAKRYSVFYQPAADGRPTAFRRRMAFHTASAA
jgi:uncharacterized protein (DUF934 family)